ncbi:hypothetical protein [Roseateles sp. LKC17W]|uniref:REDY-like protein HapK n=1 Tax=Pelomonas margarita TaxID=3299031 RepID=A0ABW7FJQ2_9BURK
MAATRLIVLFNLKPGRSVADYEAWARKTDLPTVNGLKSVAEFSVFRVTGLLGDDVARPPYQYVEIIDVKDMDCFGDEVNTDAMRRIAADFQDWADPVFLNTARLEA